MNSPKFKFEKLRTPQERKLSRQEQAAQQQLLEDDFSELRDCGYFACKPACATPLASIKVRITGI